MNHRPTVEFTCVGSEVASDRYGGDYPGVRKRPLRNTRYRVYLDGDFQGWVWSTWDWPLWSQALRSWEWTGHRGKPEDGVRTRREAVNQLARHRGLVRPYAL